PPPGTRRFASRKSRTGENHSAICSGHPRSPSCMGGILTRRRNKRNKRDSEPIRNRRLLSALKSGIVSLNLGTVQMSHQPDNIFAGTQVVALVEVRGTNNWLVHPRRAVGVVTRTPTGDQNEFLVRFPDGFEASLTRENLEVLKHFKDRLGRDGVPPSLGSGTATCDPSPFDLESFVSYRCVVGSRA